MQLKRKLLLAAGALALPVTTIAATAIPTGAAFAAVKYDATLDTVQCGSMFAAVTISPALSPTGSSATTISIKGTLYDCTDGNGDLNLKGQPGIPFTGSIKGTLTGTSNNTANLLGCSTTNGSLGIKWNATAGATEGLVNKSSTLNLTAAYGTTYFPSGGEFGNLNIPSPVNGSFAFGAAAHAQDNACAAGNLGAGSAFSGNDGGTASAAYGVTTQDAVALAQGDANSTKGTALNLGLGAAYFG